MNDYLLQVKNLKVFFKGKEEAFKVVDGLNFNLKRGQTLGIVGESGSGKTTTALSIVNLLLKPKGVIESGEINYGEKNLTKLSEREMQKIRGKEIAMIFQNPLSSLNPVLSIGSQIMETIRTHKDITKIDARERTIEILKKVGLPKPEEVIGKYPHHLSGGMRQRVMIAMALSCQPKILIADEPTTALDATIQAQIIELLNKLQKDLKLAMILITHDLGIVADLADWILIMYGGRQVEYATTNKIFKKSRHPYTWGLLRSMPWYNLKKQKRLGSISGQLPSLISLPPGCIFHPRCDYAQKKCHVEVPSLLKVGQNHFTACHFSADSSFQPKKMKEVG